MAEEQNTRIGKFRPKLLIGMILTGAALYFGVPRLINTFQFDTPYIDKKIEEGDFEALRKEIDSREKTGYIFPGYAEDLKRNAEEKISSKQYRDRINLKLKTTIPLERLLKENKYSEAKKYLASFMNRPEFGKSQIEIFQKQVEDIHPAKLEAIADSSSDTVKKIDLYKNAEREFNNLGIKTDINEKIANVMMVVADKDSDYDKRLAFYTEALNKTADQKLKQDLTRKISSTTANKGDAVTDIPTKISLYSTAREQSNDPNFKQDMHRKVVDIYLGLSYESLSGKRVVNPILQLDALLSYLKDKKDIPEIKSKNLERFIEAEETYLMHSSFNETNLKTADDNLSKVNEIFAFISPANNNDLVKHLTEKVLRSVEDRTIMKFSYTDDDVNLIAEAGGITDKYHPQKNDKVLDLYLHIFDKIEKDFVLARKTLESAIMFSEKVTEETKKEYKSELADRYVELSRNLKGKEAYFLLQSARGLYSQAGITEKDPKIQKLNNYIQDSLNYKEPEQPKPVEVEKPKKKPEPNLRALRVVEGYYENLKKVKSIKSKNFETE